MYKTKVAAVVDSSNRSRNMFSDVKGERSCPEALVHGLAFLSAIVFLISAASVKASIINATSPALAAVQAAVSSAKTGDTVQVPAGTATWTGSLVFTNDIQLIGAGPGQTIITDGGSSALQLLNWTTSSNHFDRLSGFTFQGAGNAYSYGGGIYIQGTCHSFRLDNCAINDLQQNYELWFSGWVYGVIDHCFIGANAGQCVKIEQPLYGGHLYGDGSFADADSFGTTNAMYVENCVFTNICAPGYAAIDADSGARYVARYNSFTNVNVASHGTESGQRFRSIRTFEVYENNFNWATSGAISPWAVYIRGGTGVAFSNTVVGGIEYMLVMDDYRVFPYPFTPWGNASGTDKYDSNSPTMFDSGTHNGVNGSLVLTDTTKSWSLDQWVGYTLYDASANLGAAITANTATTITYNYISNYGTNLTFSAGDSYQIRKLYASLDQPGMGQGHLLADTGPSSGIAYDTVTGTTNWPMEAPDPIYCWGNSLTMTISGFANNALANASEANIVAGRDFMNNIVKPGYTPLVYPHPLVNGTPATPTYALTVVNGNGSGSYVSNSVVTISANVPNGEAFTNWSGLDIGNSNSATTIVTMPGANLTVTANFVAVPTYTLTVSNGTGSGTYVPNSVVTISANTISGESFAYWIGSNIANTNSATTTVTTASANLTVTAVYVSVPSHMLTVSNGSGGGTYTNNSVVSISANTISGETFEYWVGSNIANTNSATTAVTMPNANLIVTAVYTASTNNLSTGVIAAADPSLASVQAAVNVASAGETVQVPAGSATWTGTLVVTNDIQLVGAGAGQTIITDNEPRSGGSDRLISWTTVANGLPRLSGFTFQGITNSAQAWDGALAFQGNCAALRIDHCKFNYICNENMQIIEPVFGVVDHCQFLQTWSDGIQVYGSGIGGGNYGDGSWATPVQWGSTNFICIESCSFYYPNYPAPYVGDGYAGARVVFRYNTVTNEGLQDFSTGTTARNRGGRAFEVYGNTFVQNAAGGNAGSAILMRSGTAVIFSNNFSGYSSTISLGNDRATCDYAPWGSANGKNLWETNSPSVLASGAATSSGSGILLDSTKKWTINQWVGGYELENVTQGGTNTGAFSLIYSNSATTLYCLAAVNGTLMTVNSGDSYQISQCYRQLDQVGLGSGDLVQDSAQGSGVPVNSLTGQPSWPHEVSEPLYQWGNTLNGANYAIGPNNVGQAYNVIRQNVDYFDNTAKPGYTPLVYPHPLVSAIVPPPTYALTVINGTGSGNYTSNSIVTISATTPTGEAFLSWSGMYITATNSANTYIVMPGANLTVTARFVPMPPTGLRIVSSSGQ